jgi:hypothetical protein
MDYAIDFATHFAVMRKVSTHRTGCRINRGICNMDDQSLNEDDQWLLTPSDHALVMTKSRANRLAFATSLTFFRHRGWFPSGACQCGETAADQNLVSFPGVDFLI